MSWPFIPAECPRCRYLEPIDSPAFDDAGYEIVGFCLHPRIGMNLFLFKNRPLSGAATCPCFRERPA